MFSNSMPSNIVTFVDHSKLGIALPNPRFLALHAAVCHVMHMSGAADVIDKFFSNDGSPAGLVALDTERGPRDLHARMAAMVLLKYV